MSTAFIAIYFYLFLPVSFYWSLLQSIFIYMNLLMSQWGASMQSWSFGSDSLPSRPLSQIHPHTSSNPTAHVSFSSFSTFLVFPLFFFFLVAGLQNISSQKAAFIYSPNHQLLVPSFNKVVSYLLAGLLIPQQKGLLLISSEVLGIKGGRLKNWP